MKCFHKSTTVVGCGLHLLWPHGQPRPLFPQLCPLQEALETITMLTDRLSDGRGAEQTKGTRQGHVRDVPFDQEPMT